MDFCDKCGGLFIPKKSKTKVMLICRRCGKKKYAKGKKSMKLTVSTVKKVKKIVVVSKKQKFEALPKTTAQCPKCENSKAFWWMQQTRAADEAPTRFHKCTKCGHVWREYE
jgi:DNA-directed RNA polymerase subunit M